MPQDGAQPNNDKPFNDVPFDAGVEADDKTDPKKYIQQLSGKLGNELRKFTKNQGTDLELEKFAINSVLSATHTSEMDSNDQTDIINKVKSSGQNDKSDNNTNDNPDNGNEDNQDTSNNDDNASNDSDNGGTSNQDNGDGEKNFEENFALIENFDIFVDINKIDNMIAEAMNHTDLYREDLSTPTQPKKVFDFDARQKKTKAELRELMEYYFKEFNTKYHVNDAIRNSDENQSEGFNVVPREEWVKAYIEAQSESGHALIHLVIDPSEVADEIIEALKNHKVKEYLAENDINPEYIDSNILEDIWMGGELSESTQPDIKPATKPRTAPTKPATTPRRAKPWRVSPGTDPNPKASR